MGFCVHVPNALGVRNQWGRIICGRCGQALTDEEATAARNRAANHPARPRGLSLGQG